MKFSLFFFAFLGVMALLNLYIYRRFFKRLHPPFNRHAFIIPSLLMTGELLFVLEASLRILPESPLLYFILSASIGITFLLFVIALIYDLNLSLFKRVPYQEERRRFIKIAFDITMLILAFSYLFKGLKGGLSKPILNSINVNIKGFPQDGYSIIQLSDIHVGRTIKRDYVDELVMRVNAENPDIVVITGDLIDYNIETIKEDLLPLKELTTTSYFILGNHEYFHGAEAAIDFIKSLGIRVLLNESLQIDTPTFSFNLLGLNDMVGARIGQYPMDIHKAYRQIDPDLPTIVLAHQPKTILQLKERPCDLMLSGHTHGGQIFPFGLLVMVDQPYLAGLYQHTKDQQIFVSRGAGYWGPPLRVMAPSEISKITIRGTSS